MAVIGHAGQLRHLVEVQQNLSTSQNALGEPIANWVTVATIRSAIEPVTGREYVIAQQANAVAPSTFTMRYHPSITAETRLKFGSRVFDIVDIANQQQRNRWLVIVAQELG